MAPFALILRRRLETNGDVRNSPRGRRSGESNITCGSRRAAGGRIGQRTGARTTAPCLRSSIFIAEVTAIAARPRIFGQPSGIAPSPAASCSVGVIFGSQYQSLSDPGTDATLLFSTAEVVREELNAACTATLQIRQHNESAASRRGVIAAIDAAEKVIASVLRVSLLLTRRLIALEIVTCP